jgi:ECF transporter S component (folate family)
MPKYSTKTLTTMALLTALEVVLSRFLSISAWNTKIGFAFVPVALAAMLLGPLYAGLVAALADFVGAILFPVGAYFPGFTLTAFLMGVCYGLFLYKKQSFPRILGAVAVHQLVLSLLLNTLWISILYGSPFYPLLLSRLPQCAILAAVQLAVLPLLAKLLPQLKGYTQ